MLGSGCCVASCRNASSDDGSVALFRVPASEADLFEKWSQALRSSASFLQKNGAVCERHFREDQIKRKVLIRDSFGNVIFQRPLVKLSLVDDAVPSIFHQDMEANPILGKKRKLLDGTSKDDSQVNNCSNIVVSFHENQTSSVQYVTSGLQALPTSTSNDAPVANDQSSEIQAVFSNASLSENGQMQIYPQGFDANAVNNLENNSGNKTPEFLDSFLANKQQVLQRIPNLNGPNVQLPKEIATVIPDDEVICLDQFDNSNGPQPKRKAPAKRPRKSTLQNPPQQSEKDANLRSFDLIYQNSDKIKLPNSTWGYHRNDKDNNIMVFSKIRWFSTNACTLPLYERQVVFHESNDLKIYINNAFSPLETPRPRDIAEMEQILAHVDRLSLCSGGPCIEFAESGALAQKDHAVGRWRHKYCPIIVAGDESVCKYCSSINQVFRYPKQTRLPFGRRSRAQKRPASGDS